MVWLFIHIAFLTGFRNRFGAILTWWVAFSRDIRRERAFTTRGVGVLEDVYRPDGGTGPAAGPRPPQPRSGAESPAESPAAHRPRT